MVRPCSVGLFLGVLLVIAPVTGQAQLYYQPQPRPIVTAENDTWFQAGDPITFDGSVYYAAGPRVYFDGNVMVRTGSFRGVPLYSDTTREPYSIVFVPLASGLMQPYERRRTGELAGGTGTQAPSFPVDIAGETSEGRPADRMPAAPGPPVWSQPDELRFEDRMTDAASASKQQAGATAPVPGTRGGAPLAPVSTRGIAPPRHVLEAGLKPKGLNEIFVVYSGYRWRSAGPALRMREGDFEISGDYHGRPVYRAVKENDEGRIYLEGRHGFVAPYERAGRPVRY